MGCVSGTNSANMPIIVVAWLQSQAVTQLGSIQGLFEFSAWLASLTGNTKNPQIAWPLVACEATVLLNSTHLALDVNCLQKLVGLDKA